jgi:acetoin utilization deacetylase AcuC-like enzyme
MTTKAKINRHLLITHPDCANHAMPHHPERPERLFAVMNELENSGLAADMARIDASEVTNDELTLVHPLSHVQHIVQTEQIGQIVKVDPDTYMSQGSTRAARLAAGAVVEATQRIIDGEFQRAFCAIRPPGHHAEVAESLGFCLFNNVAVAAQTALLSDTINRVAILDFDVHHCNGTVDIFKDNASVLVCSSFQNDFYPYRFLDFHNEHIITTPLTAGTKGSVFRHKIESSWLPALQKHKPDLIFISAGFDAHALDPLAEINLNEADFRWITELIVDQANSHSKGRIVSTLEGGYDLTSLADSAHVHVQSLISSS